MPAEQFVNDLGVGTTLATALTDTTGTTVSVVSTAGMPAAPQFRIRIGNELMLVTASSGTTLTVTRGIEGSTAATHTAGATVLHVLTVAAIGAAGIPWSAWPASPGLVVPDLSTFTWVNQGSATATQFANSITLTDPPAAGDHWRLLKLNTFPTAPYTITIYSQTTYLAFNFYWMGLYWGDGTKLVTAQIRFNSSGTGILTVDKWTSGTTLSANYANVALVTRDFWLQISDTGTNRVTRISADGLNYTTYHTIGNTDFLTATEVGLAWEGSGTPTWPLVSSLLSFKVT